LKIPGFNLKVTFDRVLNVRKKQEILDEARKLAGGVENSKLWLPHYQAARKAVKETLTAEERKLFEDEAEEWKTNGIPHNVQGE
jgi:hypothetical protein